MSASPFLKLRTASVPRISSFSRGCALRHSGNLGTSQRAAKAFVAVTRNRAPVVPARIPLIACVNELEAITDEWKELLAGRGQRHRTRLPSEQRLTAVSFQQLDLMAHCGRRHPEFRCRPLKTQTTRRGFKRTQFSKGRKFPHLGSLDEFASSALRIFAIASPVRLGQLSAYFALSQRTGSHVGCNPIAHCGISRCDQEAGTAGGRGALVL